MNVPQFANPQAGFILWFTGLSASGKTTLCGAVAASLRRTNAAVLVLDGDDLRRTICKDLGFSHADREENIRRIGRLAFEHASGGTIVLVAAISPYRDSRNHLIQASPVPFLEVFVDAPLLVCEQRDPKGLYGRVRAGLIKNFTGVDDVYESPLNPDVHCCTAQETVAESCAKVMRILFARGFIPIIPREAGPDVPLPAVQTRVADR